MFVFLTQRKISRYRVISYEKKKNFRSVHKIKALLICYVIVFTFHENFGMQCDLSSSLYSRLRMA